MFGTTRRKASSHAFLSKSPLACSVCEWREMVGSLLLTLRRYLLPGRGEGRIRREGERREGEGGGGGGRGEGRRLRRRERGGREVKEGEGREGGGEREGSSLTPMQGLLITCHAHVHVRGESGEPYEVILLPDPPLTLRAPLKEPLIFVSPSPTSSTSRLSTGMGFK